MILVGVGVGFLFALMVLAISVVSFPLSPPLLYVLAPAVLILISAVTGEPRT